MTETRYSRDFQNKIIVISVDFFCKAARNEFRFMFGKKLTTYDKNPNKKY